MNKTITILAVCISLTACFNDEPRIVQVPVPAAPIAVPAPAAAPVAAPIQAEEPRVVEVLSATANYRETQVPKQQCRNESVPIEYEEQVPTTQEVPNDEPRRQSVGGAVLGGLLGAALGHQIGQGGGRTVATGVGLIGGMAAGDHLFGGQTPSATKTVTVMQTMTRTRYEQHETCETVNETSREVENYTVTFNYKGQPVTTVMPYNPGPNLILGMAGNGGR